MTEPDNSGERWSRWCNIGGGLAFAAMIIAVLILDPESRAGFAIFAALVIVGLVIVELTRPLRQEKLPATEADYKKAEANTIKKASIQLLVPFAAVCLGMLVGRAGWYIRQGEPVLPVIAGALVMCALFGLLPLVKIYDDVQTAAAAFASDAEASDPRP